MKKIFLFAICALTLVACGKKVPAHLLIPIDEEADEIVMTINIDGYDIYVADIRLALGEPDYYVPFDIASFNATKENLTFTGVDPVEALSVIKESTEPFTVPAEKYRPVYHHTPEYGWMNDANGLFYKDGVYHLYYQYNPYASTWGNMHWGHSTSKDLIHWEYQPVALYRDPYGHIFSGSTVVDKNNTSGFGENSVVAFYTSWNTSRQFIQTQCIAYSTDDGLTFKKYDDNPVLIPFDGIADFRDPKVFWYEPESKWIMIVSADKEMRFYTSQNLKDWGFMSAWGEGFGVQPRQFECPDFFQLTTTEGETKWVMIVNVNPGCYFGGSATQYFVGDFDGTTFTCDSPKETVKWLDWGKDHYATVTFSNIEDRVVAVPWMSNWQYGKVVPTTYFRSANSIPRVLGLFKSGNEYYVSVNPVDELSILRKDSRTVSDITVEETENTVAETLFETTDGAFELNIELTNNAALSGFRLSNSAGEFVDFSFNSELGRFVMDRTKSGQSDFTARGEVHAIENHDGRKTNSMNYINDFALATWAPMSVEGNHTIQILSDVASLEVFIDGGHIAMTNLVFPAEPYNKIEFYSEGGSLTVNEMTVTALGL